MDSPSTSAAALKEEIARLTGAIDKFKSVDVKSRHATYKPGGRPRNNVYINPSYKPPSKPQTPAPQTYRPAPAKPPSLPSGEKKDVVIGGVAFESSGRSLVRKDCTLPPSNLRRQGLVAPIYDLRYHVTVATSRPIPPLAKPSVVKASFAATHAAHFTNTKIPPSGRVYKPKTARRGRPMNRNMTLHNNRHPNGARRRRYVDKPCPRFTTTGACTRGLTCPYQHDPNKIAICWPFLQGTCSHSASDCPLSHDPTPERTPLCVHFANAGRCTRANCPFPHVRVGKREGVCRDFAVLGYCEKGLDCEQQHVRECPDFAEKGVCSTKGCKLPHVIRANRNRPVASGKTTPASAPGTNATTRGDSDPGGAHSTEADSSSGSRVLTAEDAQLGDEYISLTFHESEPESDEEEEEDEQSEEEENEEGNEPQDEDLNVHVDD